MNELFKLPERLPDSPSKVPMFRATQFSTLSNRDEKYAKHLAKRLRAAQRSFAVEGEARSEGARLVARSNNRSLELYAASESLWWTDHNLAFQERLEGELPDESRARKLAGALLQKHGLDTALAKVSRVTYVECDIQKGNAKPKSERTAIDVTYSFALGKFPVMGPGQRSK